MAYYEEEKIKERLKNAVDSLTPDILSKVSSAHVEKSDDKEIFTMEQTRQEKKPGNRRLVQMIICAAAAVVLAVTGLVMINMNPNSKIDSTISIDVNPSVQITTDASDKVLGARALNDDAKAVLGDMDLKGTDAKVAVNAVIGSMVQNGYLSELKEGNAILLTVENKDASKAKQLKEDLLAGLNQTLAEGGVGAAVLSQSVESSSDAEKLAEQYGVSYGKIAFIQKLISLDSSLTMEQLAPMSLKEIAELIAQRGIDVRSIVDYEEDDSLQENIREAIEDLDEVGNAQGLIGWDRAYEIALQAAGGGTVTGRDLDEDDGKYEYEIDVKNGSVKYEITIDAQTGAVLKTEKDDDGHSADSSQFIGMEKAVEIAKGKVGEGKVVEKELDQDDAEYEIGIVIGDYEYEVKIDAKNGEVKKVYKERYDGDDDYDDDRDDDLGDDRDDDRDDDLDDDRDDDKPVSASPSASRIGMDKAAGIAQSAAGGGKIVEKELDDGKYEFTIVNGDFEYEIDVDAATGKVVKNQKERLDEDD